MYKLIRDSLVIGRLPLIAFDAIELSAEAAKASLFGFYPRTVLKRWSMSYVLVMPAIQLSDPVAFYVGVKADDLLPHN